MSEFEEMIIVFGLAGSIAIGLIVSGGLFTIAYEKLRQFYWEHKRLK
ncbi:MAG: hypothetical protein H6Q74_645 [Firmicutes bacterium]|nr:hypothetical protein [Bacillota bacterium]